MVSDIVEIVEESDKSGAELLELLIYFLFQSLQNDVQLDVIQFEQVAYFVGI